MYRLKTMFSLKYLSRYILFIVTAILLTIEIYSQSSKEDISCSLINPFLDSININLDFHQLPKSTSLIFLDPCDLIKKCIPDHWHGYYIVVVKKGSIIDSLRHFEPYFVLNGRCQYLIISKNHGYALGEKHYKKDFNLNLHQPCSNEFSEAKVRRRKGNYYITSIEGGVY